MSSTTKPYEEKMNASVNHLIHELASIRAYNISITNRYKKVKEKSTNCTENLQK